MQRVSSARVLVDGETVGEIGAGLCVLLGVADDDDLETAGALAGKVVRLRVFENDEGRFDRSLADVHGSALLVSQFTLIADTSKGNRPSFTHAARPELAEPLYEASAALSRMRESRWREESSARAWRCRSRTTGRSRSCWRRAEQSRRRALVP